MSFKIGSLTCMKYIEKQPTQTEKNECLGVLKEFLHRYFPRGLTVFYVKKDCEIKYGFEDPISNAGLGLFQLPNNQLMFSFVIL